MLISYSKSPYSRKMSGRSYILLFGTANGVGEGSVDVITNIVKQLSGIADGVGEGNVTVYYPVIRMSGTMDGVGEGIVQPVTVKMFTAVGEGEGHSFIGIGTVFSLSAIGFGEGSMDVEEFWIFNFKPKRWVGSVKVRRSADSIRQQGIDSIRQQSVDSKRQSKVI